MTKQKLTLTVDDALIEKMKSQATKEKRSLSMMTEGLYREYLERGIEEAKANLPLRVFGEITASLEVTFQPRSQHWQRFAACLGGFKSAGFNGCRERPLSPTTSDRDSTASILNHAASR